MVQVIQKISGGHWGQLFVAHADGPTKKSAALDLFLLTRKNWHEHCSYLQAWPQVVEFKVLRKVRLARLKTLGEQI